MLMCCQVYKILNNLDCLGSTYNIFKYANINLFVIFVLINSRVNVYRYSFFVNSPFLWNSLPDNIQCIPIYNNFKHYVWNFFS